MVRQIKKESSKITASSVSSRSASVTQSQNLVLTTTLKDAHHICPTLINFLSTLTPPGEDDDDEECGEEKLPSCFDYVMHFLTVFWKVLFAFVPPTEYWNGWACFVVSICMIGLLTAIIGTMMAYKAIIDEVFKHTTINE